ncbi:PopZ family protein [Rhizobium sp. 2YAF20]|uniref:PopZ family protein n=1 Tax=Rhizobium sp. 2YAF20 TaxID=3233027 RepID=UPI003F9DBC5C
MAQPNVAREPSMEEILASIRKIIESNEPGAGNAISPSLPPVYAASDEDANDIHLTVDDELVSADFDEAPPRFIAAHSQSAAREQEAPPVRAMSLADVAARVRAASDRTAVQSHLSREALPPRELPPAMAARFAEARLEPAAQSSLRSVVVDASPADPAPAAARQPEVVVPIRPVEPAPEDSREVARYTHPVSETAATVEPIAAATAAPVQQSTQQAATTPAQENRFLPQVQAEVQQVLLSEAAGEQIARSFGELAAAIDGSERRSLDEIAQDMLRPMLQDWLDDNLPTLVERLVREEIERVARGPRR